MPSRRLIAVAAAAAAAVVSGVRVPPVNATVAAVAAATPRLRSASSVAVPAALAGTVTKHTVNQSQGQGTHLGVQGQPCQCITESPDWKTPTRTTPKCIYIDLGAADGNTFNNFLHNGYGPVQNCPNGGDYEAFLVEANPRFQPQLTQWSQWQPSKVHAITPTAAFMCEATTNFYLDTTNVAENFWGSSMSDAHPDVVKSGKTKVTVPTMNLMRLLHEYTIAGDWVMVKMDIEGAEFDVVPCLARSPEASKIDRMYLEDHYHVAGPGGALGTGNITSAEYEAAKAVLRQRGVDMPQYFTNTL